MVTALVKCVALSDIMFCSNSSVGRDRTTELYNMRRQIADTLTF